MLLRTLDLVPEGPNLYRYLNEPGRAPLGAQCTTPYGAPLERIGYVVSEAINIWPRCGQTPINYNTLFHYYRAAASIRVISGRMLQFTPEDDRNLRGQ